MPDIQMTSFFVGDSLLGIEIDRVKEICQVRDYTRVPNAIPSVRGVVNLRGEVVTLIDLKTILNVADPQPERDMFNIIVNYNNENVGLAVDEIADIISFKQSSLEPAPANINGLDARFTRGVYPLDTEIAVLLNLDEVLEVSLSRTKAA